MIFSGTIFLFIFFPVILIFYYLIPRRFIGARNFLLLIGSLVFYSWGEPAVVLVMVFSIAVNFLFGIFIGKKSSQTSRKIIFSVSVLFNVLLLGYYKYANFIAENLNFIFKTDMNPGVALPIGISFFSFQIISYCADIYSGKISPQRNIFKLALYISFFPQLIAGPIIRYRDIEAQLTDRAHNLGKTAEGMQKFIVGLSKKVLIADRAAALADLTFELNSPAALLAWAGALAYAVQIYFDFSGYSDMAIGLGKMFGFEFNKNFDYPYVSRSVRDFWRRWHISLSGWFRDYLYVPLGGNKRGAARTYLNLIVVFAATGFWHGASWSFVVWGLYHGLFLLLERAFLSKIIGKTPRVLATAYTMLVVIIGWVIFRADDLSGAINYLGCMFTFKTPGLTTLFANLDLFTIISITTGCVLSAPLLPFLKEKIFSGKNFFTGEGLTKKQNAAGCLSAAGCVLLLVSSIIFFSGSGFNPFLYFRF